MEFIGFRPSQDFLTFAQDKIHDIFSEAPSDANITAEVKRLPSDKNDKFEGLLKISSVAGEFLAFANSKDFYRLIDYLYQKIHEQLQDWKKHREVEA